MQTYLITQMIHYLVVEFKLLNISQFVTVKDIEVITNRITDIQQQ